MTEAKFWFREGNRSVYIASLSEDKRFTAVEYISPTGREIKAEATHSRRADALFYSNWVT